MCWRAAMAGGRRRSPPRPRTWPAHVRAVRTRARSRFSISAGSPNGSRGQQAQVARLAVQLDISDFPTRHPYGLGLWQNHIERILAGWSASWGCRSGYGSEVTGSLHDAGVDVQLADGESLRAEYLVGCDGGRSLVRHAAGIEFAGWDPTTSALIAEAELAEDPPEWGMRRDAVGIHGLSKVEYEIRDGEIVWGDTGPVRPR